MQNLGHDGDDESENGLKEADRVEKKKATKRQRNPVAARASNSQHSVSRPDFDEVS